ncbi:MAG: DUF3644 domain-containing protein [Chloroflexi bacterium]|nr:DUF3644 domain-containing protein [Chloroflexota bacterium]
MAPRRLHSWRAELLAKSRQASLLAVQVFNNPLIQFKSESFIVLMVIAWTYLLHAYYRQKRIDYRYYDQKPKRRRFHKTKYGAYKYWELERCLNDPACPLDKDVSNNLRFLIGLRHEIEHQMTLNLDNWLSGRYQACALNFNAYIKSLFGERWGLDEQLTYSLQFIELSQDQVEGIPTNEDVPSRLRAYIAEFDNGLSNEEYASPRFSYRLLFTKKTANRKGQADHVIEFIDPNSDVAKEMDKQYQVLKEVERPKYLLKHILAKTKEEGFPGFNQHHHTQLWKALDAKNPAKGYGVPVGDTWYWYDRWVEEVREHCRTSANIYRIPHGGTALTKGDSG